MSLPAASVTVRIDLEDAAGKCFEAKTPDGVIAEVSGTNVVVYDPDAPCEGGSYIHYAGKEFKPMSAGVGPLVHTYRAGVFGPTLGIVAAQHVGECAAGFLADSSRGGEITWQVAAAYRGGRCSGYSHEL
eukprot:CAMPEP_0117460932 /NCGR_PEP_ID=MMETSP0784-20121206/2262_1 /TAXON_ID=39447 /ORGANISM="" /LENGTH=129 /DNA_ID=CAMNT_0005254619 /DNA_START=33 /DNA_END=422 /DNA_ORIENTATION=-